MLVWTFFVTTHLGRPPPTNKWVKNLYDKKSFIINIHYGVNRRSFFILYNQSINKMSSPLTYQVLLLFSNISMNHLLN